MTVQTDGSAGSSGRLLVVALSDGSQTPGSCQSCATLDYAINSDESGFGPQLDVELPGGRRTYHLSLGHDLAVAHEPTPG